MTDEGTVLGVRPGGVNEHPPLEPADAATKFAALTEKLDHIVALVGESGAPVASDPLRPTVAKMPGIRPRTAFIMMWMDRAHPDLDDVADLVKRCFASYGIDAVRADDIEHEDTITKRILDEIKTSEFLFADLTGERQSVYYEVGFAHAIGRRVMMFRKKGTRIHFDLAGYNCPEYDNLRGLESQLGKRLEHVTGEHRAG